MEVSQCLAAEEAGLELLHKGIGGGKSSEFVVCWYPQGEEAANHQSIKQISNLIVQIMRIVGARFLSVRKITNMKRGKGKMNLRRLD